MNSDLFLEMVEIAGYTTISPYKDYHFADIEIAEKEQCYECNGNMTWEGYERKSGEFSYRCFAVCTQCGHWKEF